jgi:inorganic triphosphatase YgiF
MKVCCACRKELDLSKFSKAPKSKDRLQHRCKSCFSIYNKARYSEKRDAIKAANAEWQRNNPEKRKRIQDAHKARLGSVYKLRARISDLRRNYGLTLADLEQIKETQKGLCAICLNPESNDRKSTRLVVDHNHRTGAVRALLCTPCNTAIGLMRDDATRLVRAAEYLRRHSQEVAA